MNGQSGQQNYCLTDGPQLLAASITKLIRVGQIDLLFTNWLTDYENYLCINRSTELLMEHIID